MTEARAAFYVSAELRRIRVAAFVKGFVVGAAVVFIGLVLPRFFA